MHVDGLAAQSALGLRHQRYCWSIVSRLTNNPGSTKEVYPFKFLKSVLPNRASKIQWLKEMLPILSPLGRCIVFVASRADCDALTQTILQSFAAGDSSAVSPTIVSIHGDKDQRERNQAISQFKKQPSAILIATDVASGGLDVARIMTVVNFDAAKNIDSYVHRVGRAGRLQKDGDEHQ